MSLPQGLVYIANWLSLDEQEKLWEFFKIQNTWEGDGEKKRRVLQYGVRYDYETHRCITEEEENEDSKKSQVPPIPSLITDICHLSKIQEMAPEFVAHQLFV